MNFHPALSGVRNIIDSIWPTLHASDDMKEIFGDKPMVAYRRPKNLKDVLVGAKLKGEDSDLKDKGMKKCGKSRCQISTYVHEGCNFAGAGNAYFINYSFDATLWGLFIL